MRRGHGSQGGKGPHGQPKESGLDLGGGGDHCGRPYSGNLGSGGRGLEGASQIHTVKPDFSPGAAPASPGPLGLEEDRQSWFLQVPRLSA